MKTQNITYIPMPAYCKRINASRQLVQKWLDNGEIPFVRFGRHIRIPVELADQALAAKIQNAPQEVTA